MRITVEKACELLAEAQKAFPTDALTRHCKAVGDTAAVIAKAIGLEDPEYARALGYVHDIGKCVDPTTPINHDIHGYQYLLDNGIDEQDAFICLTHSFPVQDFETFIGNRDIPLDEQAQLQHILMSLEYDDYDRLSQVCDGLGGAEGVVDIEERMRDVKRRYGSYPQIQWDTVMNLKAYFEEKCGKDIYEVVK